MFCCVKDSVPAPTVGTNSQSQALAYWRVLIISVLLLAAGVGCSLMPGESREERVLFLGWTDLGVTQLYRYQPHGGTEQLTFFESGVESYQLSPDGHQAALAMPGQNGTELWAVNADGGNLRKLFDCSQAECISFAWAPDSRRLLFEKRELDLAGVSSSPTLWWLDTQTAEVQALTVGNKSPSAKARFSPDGQWLSYHDPQQEGTVIYNLADGRKTFILNEIGEPVAWSPDSRHAILPMINLVILHGDEGEDHDAHSHDFQTAVHLWTIQTEDGSQENISGDLPVEDGAPAWSPDGQWIAFTRRPPRTGGARQLWLMRPDGSDSRALTDDPAVNHGPPSWSNDGQYLLFQQVLQDDPQADPSIWRIDVNSGEKEQLLAAGMQPTWIR